MRFYVSLALLSACCWLLSACHRPYAYFQRSPQPAARLALPPAPAATTDRSETRPSLTPTDTLPATTFAAEALAARQPERLVQQPARRIAQRLDRVNRLLAPAEATPDVWQPRPRPKSKAQARPQTLGDKLRDRLGMEPRRELNWWQRIPWQVKAATIVVLVAVIFALLKITLLAIIFGLIGAFLLIRGLKRSFKVRRPLF